MKNLSGLSGWMHLEPTCCTNIHFRADIQYKESENRNVLLTRPENVLDPGNGAAGISPSGSGASGL